MRSVATVTTAAQASFDPTALAAFRDVPLLPHASGGTGSVHALSVSGSLHRSGTLAIEFQLTADLRTIRFVPMICRPQRRDELWRHTCFELFARHGGEPGYCEFNFAPCGDWAAYVFEDYRGARRDAAQRAVEVAVQTSAQDQIQLRARVDLGSAFATNATRWDEASWRLNCAAVIEGMDGSLSYWAVHHPRPQPDFHDAEGFRIDLGGLRPAAEVRAAPQ